MRQLFRITLVIAAVGLVAACSARPYPVAPAKKVVSAVDARYEVDEELDGAPDPDLGPKPRLIGICYNATVDSYAEVSAEAVYRCGGPVELRERDWLWTPCSLLQPQRATFMCLPRQPAAK